MRSALKLSWLVRMRCALNTCVAVAVGLAERHVSRRLRLAYLAPEVLKRLVYGREGPAVTVLDLSDCAALPWAEQVGVVF